MSPLSAKDAPGRMAEQNEEDPARNAPGLFTRGDQFKPPCVGRPEAQIVLTPGVTEAAEQEQDDREHDYNPKPSWHFLPPHRDSQRVLPAQPYLLFAQTGFPQNTSTVARGGAACANTPEQSQANSIQRLDAGRSFARCGHVSLETMFRTCGGGNGPSDPYPRDLKEATMPITERTKEQLYREAKRLGIKGRSKMNKGQLKAAIARRHH
jgi:hypothetical protein